MLNTITYEQLPASTRVWIYQNNRPFSPTESQAIEQQLATFTQQWVSHNRQLQAFGMIQHQQFIVLMVDESRAGASGCSIDQSIHFIQNLEQQFGVNLFDRMTFTYEKEGQVQTASREELSRLYREGLVDDNTVVFNNLVKNKAELERQWRVPLGQSWHKRLLS
ncbi:MAG: ABC transporter ATPase [Bacteroidota bacterium]